MMAWTSTVVTKTLNDLFLSIAYLWHFVEIRGQISGMCAQNTLLPYCFYNYGWILAVGLVIINRGLILGLCEGIFSEGILYYSLSEIPENVTYKSLRRGQYIENHFLLTQISLYRTIQH
jgi:hypothetical protein